MALISFTLYRCNFAINLLFICSACAHWQAGARFCVCFQVHKIWTWKWLELCKITIIMACLLAQFTMHDAHRHTHRRARCLCTKRHQKWICGNCVLRTTRCSWSKRLTYGLFVWHFGSVLLSRYLRPPILNLSLNLTFNSVEIECTTLGRSVNIFLTSFGLSSSVDNLFESEINASLQYLSLTPFHSSQNWVC